MSPPARTPITTDWGTDTYVSPRSASVISDFAVTPQATPERKARLGRSALIAGMLVIVVALVTAATILVGGSSTGWTDTSLKVVGTPVATGGVVVVLDVTSQHRLELTGVDPVDGSIVWRRPFSASEITPGEAFGPTVFDDTVLDLKPPANADDPNVTIEGLDAATGSVLWSEPQPALLTDAPTVCTNDADFCLAVAASDTTTALVAVDPATGELVGAVTGPLRNMTVAPSGTAAEGGLWQTYDAAPTLIQVSPTDQQVWKRTVASLIGPGYDPNYGWDFVSKDGLDVGSIGSAPSNGVVSLNGYETLGISENSGVVAWKVPGSYDCGGGLQFLTSDVVCQYSGSIRDSGTSVNMAGVSLTLRGLEASSGTLTWSVPVQDTRALSIGTNVAFADATHVVVTLASGRRAVLDTQTGATTAPAPDEVFWCEQSPQFTVTTPQGASAGGKRQSAGLFRPCSASGAPTSGMPTTTPQTVGSMISEMFVWPSPTGLEGTRLPG